MLRTALTGIFVFLISCSSVKRYESSPEVIAWESDIRKFEELDKKEVYPPDAVLFTGSSSIRLWSTLQTDMAPYPVIQRGFGGSKLSDFAVYANRIIAPHRCSAIVIFIANDISGSGKDKTPGEVASLFRYVHKTIRRSHPETPLFWIEITPTPSRWKVWPQVKEANSLIKEICEKHENTYFIDTSSKFLCDDGMPCDGYFISDKLHLNQDGYEIWTQIIRNELMRVIQ